MSEHTDGPWRAQDYPQRLKGQEMSALEVRGVSSRAGPDRDRVQDRHIAFVGWPGGTHRDQMEANARLIAAAPDLLEAAKKAEGVLADMKRGEGEDHVLSELHAAIAKAEGNDE